MRRPPLGLGLLAVLASLSSALPACGDESSAPPSSSEPRPRAVTLALDFMPNAVHAGVYGAVLEGEDRARDVTLDIRAPGASTDSLRLLESGRADLAIVDIHDLGLARERGGDLVGVGAIVQRPLAAVIARGEVERPRELEHRRVGVTGLPSDEAVLRAVIAGDRGDPDSVRRVTIGFSAVRDLAAGNVDAALAFWNAEGVALRERGVETTEFRVDEFDAPRYPELVLAARRETIEQDPRLVESVLGAVAAGTEHALADPDRVVGEIEERSGAERELVRAQLDAVAPALRPPVRLDRDDLEAWAEFDARFGILERPPDVEEAFALGLEPER